MDVGCILKGSTASVIWYWDSFHIDIIYDFRELSQICNLKGYSLECAAISPSTTVYGVQTPNICMTWMWDAF
jgi:hypothetical protein